MQLINNVLVLFVLGCLVVAEANFIYVLMRQVQTLRVVSVVQPLKKLLLAFVVIITISTIPIIYLFLLWALGQKPGYLLSIVASLSYAVSRLLEAFVLNRVYNFKSSGD